MLWLSSAVAHAEPVEVAAAKTLWNAQLAAINSKTPSAFRDTFDDSAYVLLPGSELHADSYNLAKFADHWFLDLGTYKVTSLKIGDLRDNKLAWIVAELVDTADPKQRLRVTEFVAVKQPTDGSGAGSIDKPKASDYRVLGASFTTPLEDQQALALAAKSGLTPLVPIDGGSSSEGFIDDPKYLASFPVIDDPAAAVIGSAAAEVATGKAAVAAKLKSWKSLAYKTGTQIHVGEYYNMNAAALAVFHIQIGFKVGGKEVLVPYRVMTLTSGPPPATHGTTYLVFAHYSIEH